jgi:hypothetical protein
LGEIAESKKECAGQVTPQNFVVMGFQASDRQRQLKKKLIARRAPKRTAMKTKLTGGEMIFDMNLVVPLISSMSESIGCVS